MGSWREGAAAGGRRRQGTAPRVSPCRQHSQQRLPGLAADAGAWPPAPARTLHSWGRPAAPAVPAAAPPHTRSTPTHTHLHVEPRQMVHRRLCIVNVFVHDVRGAARLLVVPHPDLAHRAVLAKQRVQLRQGRRAKWVGQSGGGHAAGEQTRRWGRPMAAADGPLAAASAGMPLPASCSCCWHCHADAHSPATRCCKRLNGSRQERRQAAAAAGCQQRAPPLPRC